MDFDLALKMAKLCQASYTEITPQTMVDVGLCEKTSEDQVTVKFNTVNSQEYYIVKMVDRHEAYVVFRGTDSFVDGCYDADIRRVGCEFGSCHKGFFTLWHLLRDDIAETIRDCNAVYYTGHSLGGALATLAGLFLRQGFPTGHVYTFGCPKLGDTKFTRSLECLNLYRFIRARDLVPKLPLGPRFSTPPEICLNTSFFSTYVKHLFCVASQHSVTKYVESLEKKKKEATEK